MRQFTHCEMHTMGAQENGSDYRCRLYRMDCRRRAVAEQKRLTQFVIFRCDEIPDRAPDAARSIAAIFAISQNE